MSRIGKLPVKMPNGVECTIAQNNVTIKGPTGTLKQSVPAQLKINYNSSDRELTVEPIDRGDISYWALWGLHRALINNMVIGVTKGFQKTLEIEGIGYRAELKGKTLMISAGYSHPIMYMPPNGISFSIEGTNKVTVSGIEKQSVGQVAAEIRGIRPPEPYKGKGIKYKGERIIRKAGKTGTK